MYFKIPTLSSAQMDEVCKFQSAGAASLVRGAQGSELLGCSLKTKCHSSIYNFMLSFGFLSLYQESCLAAAKNILVTSSAVNQVGIFIFSSDRGKQNQMAGSGGAFSWQRVFTQAFMLSKSSMSNEPSGSIRTAGKMKWKPWCLPLHPTGNSQQPF